MGIRYLLCFGLILLAKFPTQRPCQLHFTPKLGVKWYNLTACRVRHGVRPDLICQPGHSPGIKTHSSPAAFPTTLSLSFSVTKIIAVSCLSSDLDCLILSIVAIYRSASRLEGRPQVSPVKSGVEPESRSSLVTKFLDQKLKISAHRG